MAIEVSHELVDPKTLVNSSNLVSRHLNWSVCLIFGWIF